MTSAYVLTSAAAADVRAIIRHTREQSGEAQARIYVAKLEKGIARLAKGKAPFRDMSALYPALRMARCESHYLFCLTRADAPALLVAVFSRTDGFDDAAR